MALAALALNPVYQRFPLVVVVPATAFLALALARPPVAVPIAAVAVPLLPVAGNLLAGPWVAPAEALILLLAAALLVREDRVAPSRLGAALGLSAVAMAVGATSSTLAALAPPELPAALAGLARSLFAPGTDHAALPLRAGLVHAAGLLGYVAFRRAAARRGVERVLAAVVVGLAGVGLYAVVEASTGLKLWPEALYELLSRGKRVPATLPDYNATGAALALGLFPAVAFARVAHGARRVAWVAAAVLMSAGLLLSGSRGAWLSAGAALAVTLVTGLRSGGAGSKGERLRLALAALAGSGLLAAAVAVWPGEVGELLRHRAATLLRPAELVRSVEAGRLGFWRAGLGMIASHPLGGVGPGRVPSRFAEYRAEDFPVDVENLHCYFLQAVAENGVPGGLLVLWPFVPLAALVRRSLWSRPAFASPVHALGPGLLAFGLTGFTAHPWLLAELQLVFWGAAALLHESLPPKEPDPKRAGRRRWAAWGLLLAWAVPGLALAPGTERGRFGTAEWGAREAEGRFFWTGPSALVPVAVPDAGRRFVVRVRAMAPDVEVRPVFATIRLDGGHPTRLLFVDQEWQDVTVERGPLRPGPAAPETGLLSLEASRGFCPARGGSRDRRVLSLQLARPPLRPAAGGAP